MDGYISYADLRTELERIGKHSAQTINVLYDFGVVMIGEVDGRSAQIDTKMGIYLAGSIAIMALLGVSTETHPSPVSRCGSLIALVFAFAAMMMAAINLRSRLWPFPAERAWFNDKEIGSEDRLKRTNVLALLESHQERQKKVESKIGSLVWIEVLLVLSACAMTVVLLARLTN